MNDKAEREASELIAYLDGELDAEATRRIEERLLDDGLLRARLSEYQRSWDMLDDLPHHEASQAFARSTLETVAASTSQLVEQHRGQAWRNKLWRHGAIALGAAVALFAGYMLTRYALIAPARQLAEDLPLIERLDAYRHAESVDFLKRLAEQDVFPEEEGDVL